MDRTLRTINPDVIINTTSRVQYNGHAEYLETEGEIVEAEIEEAVTNCWVCTCGAENKGKFCPDCGKTKPAGIPQYKCDKCGWEPDDKTRPPKFCPECGDPFDDGDIVLV